MTQGDWSQFGGDPVPGDLYEIKREINLIAQNLTNEKTLLNFSRGVHNQGSQIVWQGFSAEKFKNELSTMIPDLERVLDSNQFLLDTLQNYKNNLEELQNAATTQHAAAVVAQEQVRQAQLQVSIEQEYLRSSKSSSTLESTAQLNSIMLAQSALNGASQNLSHANAQLAAVLREIENLRIECQVLQRKCTSTIISLSETKITHQSWWNNIVHGTEHAAKLFITTEAAIVVGVSKGVDEIVKVAVNEVDEVGKFVWKHATVIGEITQVVGVILVFTPLAGLTPILEEAGSAIQITRESSDEGHNIVKVVTGQESIGKFAEQSAGFALDVVSTVISAKGITTTAKGVIAARENITVVKKVLEHAEIPKSAMTETADVASEVTGLHVDFLNSTVTDVLHNTREAIDVTRVKNWQEAAH